MFWQSTVIGFYHCCSTFIGCKRLFQVIIHREMFLFHWQMKSDWRYVEILLKSIIYDSMSSLPKVCFESEPEVNFSIWLRPWKRIIRFFPHLKYVKHHTSNYAIVYEILCVNTVVKICYKNNSFVSTMTFHRS